MNCNTTHYRANSSSVPGDPTRTSIGTHRLADALTTGELPPDLIAHVSTFLDEAPLALVVSAVEDEIARHGDPDPFWTFGGGTALMLRYEHRRSKDIDIFVPDPQHLGYVSPRLSDVAETVARDYVEGAGFVKLIREEGEIDFVASENLTHNPHETWTLLRRSVRVETPAEIVAKELWHRGDRLSARDLFDFSLVVEQDPEPLRSAGQFLVRHREAFLRQSAERTAVLRAQFDAIDTLKYKPTFDDAAARTANFLAALPGPR